MIELRNIDKIFNRGTINEVQLFHDFSLTVQDGEFIAVIGSNGSGKTTMLNIISGTLPIENGQILMNGKDITRAPEYQRAARIGRVHQNPSQGTVPGMTILENLSLAENKGKPYLFSFALRSKDISRYREMLAQLNLGLEDKINIPVGLLSGGQRQALALLMSTMTPIDLLLLDEHTAALDPKTSEIIMQITDRIVSEKHVTTLMVTHNLRYAVEYGSRTIMMHEGHAILDCAGEAKKEIRIPDLLQRFNEISIECGN